jgi:glycosyltransferase involved in cell wall biosynthesis
VNHACPRPLAGTTILQAVPSLRDGSGGKAAVDIVHAQSAGAAWSALAATHKQPVYLVTSFPDRLPGQSYLGNELRSTLAPGNHVIAPSPYVSRAMIERCKLAPDCITVIPRAIDIATFSPPAVGADRVAALRCVWGVLPEIRVVLVPGRVAPWNGQMSMVDAVRLIVDSGNRNIVFVFAGEDRVQPRHAHNVRRPAHMHGIETLCRFVGHCADMPAALATSDVVVVPSLEPPLAGRVAAQAMGRPLVTPTVGVLPENLLCPPRMRDELRTGWLVRPGDVGELAHAVGSALSLDIAVYEALGARAAICQIQFSPQSVAEAIRGVYRSVLADDS